MHIIGVFSNDGATREEIEILLNLEKCNPVGIQGLET